MAELAAGSALGLLVLRIFLPVIRLINTPPIFENATEIILVDAAR
jgi:hypothetical protein